MHRNGDTVIDITSIIEITILQTLSQLKTMDNFRYYDFKLEITNFTNKVGPK